MRLSTQQRPDGGANLLTCRNLIAINSFLLEGEVMAIVTVGIDLANPAGLSAGYWGFDTKTYLPKVLTKS
jgi:hypothetical protein